MHADIYYIALVLAITHFLSCLGQGRDAKEVSKGAGVLALLANTVAARERPIDALAIMAKAVEHAVILEGTRGEAEEAAERLLGMLT